MVDDDTQIEATHEQRTALLRHYLLWAAIGVLWGSGFGKMPRTFADDALISVSWFLFDALPFTAVVALAYISKGYLELACPSLSKLARRLHLIGAVVTAMAFGLIYLVYDVS